MIPPFDSHAVFVIPWSENLSLSGWTVLMGFLVATACGLIGNFLVLRRMALVGDAISHSVLPGIVIAFLLADSRSPLVMFAGALVAGLITTLLIEGIHRATRVKQDAAIGIVFSSMFALGVVLLSLFAGHVDLDADCVLYGDLSFIGMEPPLDSVSFAPAPVTIMAGVCAGIALLIVIFYRQLLVSSFDPALAATLGIRPALVHHALMAALSVVVVGAFRAVGAILVVAMLILPGATSYLLVKRLPAMLVLSVGHAALSAVAGMHLDMWLSCGAAPAMVVAGAALFLPAWLFNRDSGLAWRTWRTAKAEPA